MRPKGYHHVTRDLRCQIYALKTTGLSLRAIARELNLSASTVSREIKRNSGERGYRYQQADKRARQRRSQASQRPKKMTAALSASITAKLSLDWSPEQIAGRLTREGTPISHETIYRLIWQDKAKGGSLYKQLRHQGKRYTKRSSGKSGRGCIPQRVDISERPAIVEEKKRIGDWEGDTVIGARHQGALVTYVDRHSKLALIKKISAKTAENVLKATLEKMSNLPHPLHTITFDNGKEFSQHQSIAKQLNTTCYFATPYHSWERGLNEHTNGLIRQYLPKSSDLTCVTDAQIQAIEDRLNHRPRKVLQYRTPFEVFFASSTSTQALALQG